MTYAGFLALFVVPPLVVVAFLCRRDLAPRPLAALLVIVYATATPWDGAAIARGYWGFDPARILGVRAFGVPVEELAFFGLWTLLTAIWVQHRVRGPS